jgi:outer membrane receptor for monomeric catechols
MSSKSLKIKVDNLSDENYIDVANKVAKVIKASAPDSRVSILGADSEVLEGKSQKQIKQVKNK